MIFSVINSVFTGPGHKETMVTLSFLSSKPQLFTEIKIFNKVYIASLSSLHSVLKLEKSAISKVQKHIFYNFKNGKKSSFAPQKSLKLQKCNFKLFSGAKIDFLPLLKWQKMYF